MVRFDQAERVCRSGNHDVATFPRVRMTTAFIVQSIVHVGNESRLVVLADGSVVEVVAEELRLSLRRTTATPTPAST